jgi:hypothetical protein
MIPLGQGSTGDRHGRHATRTPDWNPTEFTEIGPKKTMNRIGGTFAMHPIRSRAIVNQRRDVAVSSPSTGGRQWKPRSDSAATNATSFWIKHSPLS